jgi:hypothetical protein
MSDTSKALDALTLWQKDTRQQIVNEIGAALLKALHKIGFQADIEPHVSPKPRPRKQRTKRVKKSGLRSGTDMERVYNVIQRLPGNKGFQIQAMLAMEGTVVHERTLRTCLNRLKARGYITQGADKTWYSTEDAKL